MNVGCSNLNGNEVEVRNSTIYSTSSFTPERLLFCGDVDRHDAAGQVPIFHMAESCLAQQLGRAVPDRERRGSTRAGIHRRRSDPVPPWCRSRAADGTNTNHRACAAMHARAAKTPGRRTVRPASRPVESPLKACRQIADIAHAKSGRHRIKCVVAKSQLFCIRLEAGDLACVRPRFAIFLSPSPASRGSDRRR